MWYFLEFVLYEVLSRKRLKGYFKYGWFVNLLERFL